MAVTSDAETRSSTAGAGAADHRIQGMDAEFTHDKNFDSQSSRQHEFVKDLGFDEALAGEVVDQTHVWNANKKRTYDVHQSMDFAAAMANQRYQNADSEQRLVHQAKLNALEIEMKQAEHNQRLRHADAMAVMSTGVVGEMVEAISNRVITYMETKRT